MPIEIRLTKPQSTPSKVLGATAGLIPRTGTALLGIPRGIGDMMKYVDQLNPSRHAMDWAGVPQNVREQIGFNPGHETLPTDYLPSSDEMNQSLKSNLIENKSSPVRDYLPRNLFDTVPYLDNPVQAIAAAPYFGASRLSQVIPAFSGEAFGQAAESMKANPALKLFLETLGYFVGSKGQQVVGSLAKHAAPVASKSVQNFAEKYIPGARTYNKVASQEQRAAQKAEQSIAKEESRTSTMRDKMNQESIDEASAMDWESVKAKEAEAKASAKEAERLKGEVEKSNQASIDESSSRDADMMKRRTSNADQIDKFQAENDHIMSLEDAGRLKDKLKKGESVSLEDWLDEKSKSFTTEANTHARTLEDMHYQEGITMANEGASPKEVKERINKNYEVAENSIPDILEQGAAAFEGSLNQLDKMTGVSDLTQTAQSTIKEIVDAGRKLIKNGKVKVKDLMNFKKEVNSKMRKLNKTQGGLVGVEKKYHLVNDAIDKTMEHLKKSTTSEKIVEGVKNWFEGNRLSKNLAQDAEASKWFSAEMNKGGLQYLAMISEKGGHYFKSPEIRKYVHRAVSRYASRDIKQATRDLIMADKAAEKIVKEESKINKAPGQTRLPKGMGRELIIKDNSLSL